MDNNLINCNEYIKIQRWLMIILLLLMIIIIISVIFNVIMGPSDIRIDDIYTAIFDKAKISGFLRDIIIEIRIPYAIMSVLIGMSLGLSGAEMQTILNNQLASPFTLGVSQAASFGAALAIILGIKIPGIPTEFIIPANAFLFSVISILILNSLAKFAKISTAGIVLFGIALVFSFNALTSLMQYIASEDALQSLVFWTIGSLTKTSWMQVFILSPVLIICTYFSFKSSWKLTTLKLGEEKAKSLGVDVSKLRYISFLRISILTATCVSFAGPIGFIGLISPNISRLLFGEEQRFYLIGSLLVGGAILSIASLVSNNIVPGVITPVGIITSLVGVPIFIAIIFKYRGNL